MSSQSVLEAGRIIGEKYRLRREIGSGGMGSVWSAVHETLDRKVAIKFLTPTGDDAETANARFVTEARSAARVKQRFIVDVFDFGITEDGITYMVQEYLDGEVLGDVMFYGPAWDVKDVVHFAARCCSGLAVVHEAGIIHRDLKPDNVFVMRDVDGRFPKILDFGISKLDDIPMSQRSTPPPPMMERVRELTEVGTTVGTPRYMSPEQIRGRRDLDGRADIYSMGVMLFEWFTGDVPYPLNNMAELLMQITKGGAPALVARRPDLGEGISAVIAKALEPERDKRWKTANEMADALMALLPDLPQAFSIVQKSGQASTPGQPGEAATPSPTPQSTVDESRQETDPMLFTDFRPRRNVLIYGAAAAILLAAVLMVLMSDGDPPAAEAPVAASASEKPAQPAAAVAPAPPPVVTPIAEPLVAAETEPTVAPKPEPAKPARAKKRVTRRPRRSQVTKPAETQAKSKKTSTTGKKHRTLDF